MISQEYKNFPKVIIDNEDDTLSLFYRLLIDQKYIDQHQNLKCERVVPPQTLGSRLKKYELAYKPYTGFHEVKFEDSTYLLHFQHLQAKITTECRKIQHIKVLTIYGKTIAAIKKFIAHVFSLLQSNENDGTMTIYENNGGGWRISKEKRPRKLESVVFKEEFIQNILGDITEFINSEEWYLEMGIPYKRSYLFYGPPGTGKSSLAQALAATINFSICFVNCSDRINDFNFNHLLNTAPKKAVILIEDVDSIFSERKNTEKNNALTFSGFLNAIDGVRSQEGRVIIMTTNYRQRLDPALLRPGRVDEMYEIGLASRFQIQKMCERFFKDHELAVQFAARLPQGKFSMSMVQGFLLKHRKNPKAILEKVEDLLQSDENVKIDQFLNEINCNDCLNDFRMEECYTLAGAKNLPKSQLQKVTLKLSSLLKGRLFQTIRLDRRSYIKSHQDIEKFIEEITQKEDLQRELRSFSKENNCTTFYQIKDRLKQLEEKS